MSVSNARIIIHFDIHQPIELMDLTISFNALAKQYRKFLADKARQTGHKIHDDDVKLFITKIENNCILAELAGASSILGTLIPVMEYTDMFVNFVKNIDVAISYFKKVPTQDTQTIASDIPYSKKECQDIANFLNVVAQNTGGNLGLTVAEYTKNSDTKKEHIHFKFTSDEALQAQKGALIAERALEYKSDADYKNVLMYFHQTNIEAPKTDGTTGDKAIIRAISDKPLRVYFISDLDNDKIKSFIHDPVMNPFKASYRVDVNVEKDRNNIPLFYRVMRLHEIISDANG